MVRQLPIVKIDNKHYFVDDRLQEYRLTTNPHQRIRFDELGGRKPELMEDKKELHKKIKRRIR